MRAFAALLLALLAACGPQLGELEAGESGRVTRAMNGDTLELDSGLRIFLAEIDARGANSPTQRRRRRSLRRSRCIARCCWHMAAHGAGLAAHAKARKARPKLQSHTSSSRAKAAGGHGCSTTWYHAAPPTSAHVPTTTPAARNWRSSKRRRARMGAAFGGGVSIAP